MSSDYIARLRHELLRAGADAQTRRRPVRATRALRPLATAAAVLAVIALVLVVALNADLGDERPAEPAGDAAMLDYRVEPPGAAEQTGQVMRVRLAAAGVSGAEVSVSSDGALTIAAPGADRAAVTPLTQPGKLAFYDWEASVLGPDGAPAPSDPSVTGGADAGHGVAVSRAEAERRAALQPDGRVVRGEDGGWVALGGEPALTNADVAGADATVLHATGQPFVIVDLTPRGRTAFEELTRELAQRGLRRATPGRNDIAATQHLAIVIDDRVVAMPFIDFNVAPDGIDGSEGAQISGELTPDAARRIASIIDSGPLPARLTGP
jgi:preprotein translocase subunit SecD